MKLQLQGQNYSPLLSFSIIKFSVSLLRPGNHPSLAPSIPLSMLKKETFSAVIDLVIFWAPNMSASLMQSPTQVSWHYAIHANMVTMGKKTRDIVVISTKIKKSLLVWLGWNHVVTEITQGAEKRFQPSEIKLHISTKDRPPCLSLVLIAKGSKSTITIEGLGQSSQPWHGSSWIQADFSKLHISNTSIVASQTNKTSHLHLYWQLIKHGFSFVGSFSYV